LDPVALLNYSFFGRPVYPTSNDLLTDVAYHLRHKAPDTAVATASDPGENKRLRNLVVRHENSPSTLRFPFLLYHTIIAGCVSI
jgi:hypothetical protein